MSRAVVGILSYPTGQTYKALLISQGFTNYWSLQSALANTNTEADLIGSRTMTMSSGATTNNTSGPLTAADGANAQTFVTSDTETLTRNDTAIGGDTSWSLVMWVKMTVQTGTANILSAFELSTDSNSYIYLIRRDDRSGLTIQIGDGAGGGGANFIDFGDEIENDGSWHHIVVTRAYSVTSTADTWKLYLDNVNLVTTTRSAVDHVGIGTNLNRFSIGNRNAADVGMDGSIAHVSFADGVTIDAAAVSAQWGYRNF